MQTSDNSVHWTTGKFCGCVRQDVDDPGVPAAGHYDQALRGVEHQGLVLGDRVLDQAIWRLHLPTDAPVSLRVPARHRAGQPRAWEDVITVGVLDKCSTSGFVLFANRDHPVVLASGR